MTHRRLLAKEIEIMSAYTQPYYHRSRIITRKQILERRRFYHKISSIALGILLIVILTKTFTYPPVLADTSVEIHEPSVSIEQPEVKEVHIKKNQSALIHNIPIEEPEETIVMEEAIVNYDQGPVESIPEPTLEDLLGNETISWNGSTLTRMSTPDKDYWTFQPFEDYHCITNKSSSAYKVTYSENSYTDNNGFRRVGVQDQMFSVDGSDDYCVAMGTFYKPKGVCGIRFLIVTDVGMFTVITADEKSDQHTNDTNMYTLHGENKQYAGVLEYLVDTDLLPNMVARMGSVHYAPFEPLNGEIKMIYRID